MISLSSLEADLFSAVSTTDTDGRIWVDLALDARATEALGALVVECSALAPINAVVTWFAPDDTVIGHVVSRELGVPRSSIEVDLGLMTLSPALPVGARVLLVVVDPSAHEPVAAVAGLLANHGLVLSVVTMLTTDHRPGIITTVIEPAVS